VNIRLEDLDITLYPGTEFQLRGEGFNVLNHTS
jgi:hypothetical protein